MKELGLPSKNMSLGGAKFRKPKCGALDMPAAPLGPTPAPHLLS